MANIIVVCANKHQQKGSEHHIPIKIYKNNISSLLQPANQGQQKGQDHHISIKIYKNNVSSLLQPATQGQQMSKWNR